MNSCQAGPFAENAATPRGYGPEIRTGPQINVGDGKSSQNRDHYKVALFKKLSVTPLRTFKYAPAPPTTPPQS